LAIHAVISRSNATTIHLNLIENRTSRLHGKTLRQLTAASTDVNTLLTSIETAWITIIEEWQELEKARFETVDKLTKYTNEEITHKPSWWSEVHEADVEGSMLCLLMTGLSEPSIVKWVTEAFATVVCVSYHLP
jgi:Anaphase-promoting complex, cyclosome, subunit 4